MPNGKGAPGRLQLYVDGTLVGDADAAVTTPFMLQPRRADLRRQPGLTGHAPTTQARSRSPAPSTASPSTSAAS